jgi:hypothetical protein
MNTTIMKKREKGREEKERKSIKNSWMKRKVSKRESARIRTEFIVRLTRWN